MSYFDFSENDANGFLGNHHDNSLKEEEDVDEGVANGISEGGGNSNTRKTTPRFYICGQLMCYEFKKDGENS